MGRLQIPFALVTCEAHAENACGGTKLIDTDVADGCVITAFARLPDILFDVRLRLIQNLLTFLIPVECTTVDVNHGVVWQLSPLLSWPVLIIRMFVVFVVLVVCLVLYRNH
jgi:hypothetical protein